MSDDKYLFPSGNPRPRPVPPGTKIIIPDIARCSECGNRHVSWRDCRGKSRVGKIIDIRPGCLR